MAKEDYLEHLNKRLSEIDAKIFKARSFLNEGKDNERVAAAAELTLLEADHDQIAKKIAKAKGAHAEDWSSLHTTFQEDLDALSESIESWIVQHHQIGSS